ncbi:hypothetical protein [Methyloceanibacter sp. wino2]|uniref:hypothetical protein n=1 Tax=Methyloceanibacter sp. wino2 TaxID=2170729 RepID=UPI001ABB874F|nr:hypothetical protein [Methyloceanibacter sp. wino2]
MNILDAVADRKVFASLFRDKSTWTAWFAFLAALFGLPMDRDMRRIYRQCTNRSDRPRQQAQEAWLVIGRRGGKSFVLALIACFLACFRDWRPYLGPGERATVMVIAADRKQAKTIIRYVKGILHAVPMLKACVEGETQESVNLKRSVTIEVHSCSFRTVRGYTIVAALCDEIAFWRSDDSANPDSEVIAAIRPAMATIPDGLLLCASSPYARRGVLWDTYQRHFGKDGDSVLVWQAPTKRMNPAIRQSFLDDEYDKDPVSAAAEYGAEFRTDIESFVSREAVDACVSVGVHERPYDARFNYAAFVDPSGGSSDSFTLGIGHNEDDRRVLDCLREVRPPFSPSDVVAEFARTLKAYRITKVNGDRYAGEWPVEQFDKCGIEYVQNARPKSDIYRDALPLLNSGQVQLLEHKKLFNQIVGLERRTARGGRDSIDHAPGAHDDCANAALGVLVELEHGGYDISRMGKGMPKLLGGIAGDQGLGLGLGRTFK